MAIRPILVDKQSPFVGEHCALCKEPFSPGEDIILCPADASRHHVPCWQAAGNRCSAYGCTGSGQPILRRPFAEEEDAQEPPRARRVATPPAQPEARETKVQTYPSASLSCAQGCLIVAIAVSILLFSVSCFGLWAMLDYLLMEVLGWHYRAPLSEAPLSELHLLLTTFNDIYLL
ncbi:MAG: RING finger protein [Candidatus Promineifilaceae bacterium]|nr:RING finger protein [Candidatus Promineifilaceae bacterium]